MATILHYTRLAEIAGLYVRCVWVMRVYYIMENVGACAPGPLLCVATATAMPEAARRTPSTKYRIFRECRCIGISMVENLARELGANGRVRREIWWLGADEH